MSVALYPGRRVLWLPFGSDWKPPSEAVAFCCEAMRLALRFDCDQHADPFECADSLVVYNEVFDEYGLIVHDGGPSYVGISHCPWCATKLPESQRDRWFEETESLPEPLPAAYLSGEWRRR